MLCQSSFNRTPNAANGAVAAVGMVKRARSFQLREASTYYKRGKACHSTDSTALGEDARYDHGLS